MKGLEILTAPDPRLREKAVPVDKVDHSVRQLMDQLLETMYHNNGIGLASVQVGILKKVIVVDLDEQDGVPFQPLLMANPEILSVSSGMQVMQEGCLSVPGFYVDVERPLEIEATYIDENNQTKYLKASGLLATCLQHEIDHLNGVLFVDHISSLRRKLILSKLEKKKNPTKEKK